MDEASYLYMKLLTRNSSLIVLDGSVVY